MRPQAAKGSEKKEEPREPASIFFLALYPKNKKSDLSPKEKEAIKEQIRTIKEDSYP